MSKEMFDNVELEYMYDIINDDYEENKTYFSKYKINKVETLLKKISEIRKEL